MNKQILNTWTHGDCSFSLYSLPSSLSSCEFVLECSHSDPHFFPAPDRSKAELYARYLINSLLTNMSKEGIITIDSINRDSDSKNIEH